MRRLLQNKTFVSSAVAVACLCLLWDLVGARLGKTVTASARAIASPDDGGTLPALPTVPRVFARLTNWTELTFVGSRDPFLNASLIQSNSVTADGAFRLVDPNDPESPDQPALVVQAISLSGDRAFAVINRQIVQVGSQLGDFRVHEINRDGVVFKVLNKEVVIRVMDPRPSPKPPVDAQEKR